MPVAKGLATHIPGLYKAFGKRHMNISEATPEYFYGVWLKHVALLSEVSKTGVPKVVAELGPGDTLGTAVAALLSGADYYIALDTLPYADRGPSRRVAEGVRTLFEKRHPLVSNGQPDFGHLLNAAGFPTILTDQVLLSSLEPARAAAIIDEVARATEGGPRKGAYLNYVVPFDDSSLEPESVDWLISHAVLEHIVDLPSVLALAHRWLKPNGLMSHQFDLRSHEIVPEWDGHRAFGARAWKMVVGKRPFLINRLPFSAVCDAIEKAGFRILKAERIFDEPTLSRDQLCPEWRVLPDEDLRSCGGFIQAIKI